MVTRDVFEDWSGTGEKDTQSTDSVLSPSPGYHKPKSVLWDEMSIDEQAHLDDQTPGTLFYLARVVGLPQVATIYAEYQDDGVKIWTVLSERDFEIMDKIYDIERDVKNRFPDEDLQFRVTVQSETGPSIRNRSVKLYENS